MKISLTHQVEVDTVVNQVIFASLDIPGSTEVHPVLLADMLDLIIGTSQAHNTGVELLEVVAQNLRAVAGRVTGNEDRHEDLVITSSFVNLVDDLSHLIQLVRADIRAMRETEVDLTNN